MSKEIYYPQVKAIWNCIFEVLTGKQQKYRDIVLLNNLKLMRKRAFMWFITVHTGRPSRFKPFTGRICSTVLDKDVDFIRKRR